MKKTDHFVQFVLGVVSALGVAGVVALAGTMVQHEVKLAVLWENCPKCRTALASVPRDRTPSFWSAFGFVPRAPLEQTARKERYEKPRD